MKKKFNYLITIIIVIIILIGVSFLTINWKSLNEYSKNKNITKSLNQQTIDKYYVKKSDKGIFFNITQTKPSSCHIINFNKTDFDKKIILDLNISKYTNKCASNNSSIDTVSGEIEIKNPKSVEIRVNGNRVYFTEFPNTNNSLS